MQKQTVEIKHFHLFCGAGGGAKGFNNGRAEVGSLEAKFRCLGGIDVDPAGIKDFQTLSGVPGTVLDMFDRSQYKDFHGQEPPKDWKEATPEDIRKAAGNERPHIVFLSAPCKGFSGLLAENKSRTAKYQALNRLTVRGVFLMLEAFGDDPPELILFENVPLIATRGRKLLDSINSMLEAYGYAVAETTHDCGEIGGLGQSRKRFLLVARHREKIQPFLYEPEKKPLRGVGEILSRLPIPGGELGGPMHRVPSLQWKTWVRLAFVEAGKDWRSLNRLRVADGILQDYLIVPDNRQNGFMGVKSWSEPSGTVAGRSRTGNGAFSVADPRPAGVRHNNVFRVVKYDQHSPAITSGTGPSAGGLAVSDPRTGVNYSGYGVKNWKQPSNTVAGESFPSNGSFSVADPRFSNWHPGASSSKFRVTEWEKATRTVTGSVQVASGAQAVSDPRIWSEKNSFKTGGHYGVVRWDQHSGVISGAGKHDNGKNSVADPRLPGETDQLVARIISEDGTWHRPFTTLELAALQGLIDPEENLILDGLSDSDWRERIGNAVPPPAAEAIAGQMGETLLLAWSGQTMSLGNTPIWVRNISVALSV
jgi:site-specific DNA-cytosine methylase